MIGVRSNLRPHAQARERERERELQTLDCEEVDAWLLQTLKDISMRWRPASFDPAGLNLEPSTLNSKPYPLPYTRNPKP